ncbi:sulfatase-like hydrolase/transferase [Marinitoga sp. 38H-ov]|uniref:sulfatase-like hydrolase/transferase n=1 Tax=Marinitoga sp. 38H-ov TaxID=1755814 RepID=UPI0013ED122D|nr:sulfatase-like hydrolase/transferase [Marinitoga sp. 38H-ov]KAF2956280.1 hypothetical protein AS160_00345 [Marinitoga sp. 38H-ov]
MNKNIFLIITDCLRKDYFDKMEFSKKVDLSINNAYSVAPNTFFAVPSILTGTYPFQIIKNSKIMKSLYTFLPKIANQLEYLDIFITGNTVTSRAFGYYINKGYFNDFFEKSESEIMRLKKENNNKKNEIIKYLNDYKKLKSLIKLVYNKFYKPIAFKITKNDFNIRNTSFETKVRIEEILNTFKNIEISKENKYFGFIHLMDTHTPYGAPYLNKKKLEKAQEIIKKLYYMPLNLKKKEIEFLKELYEGEVDYLDKNLEILINEIDKKFNLENSLVVVVSDHGEAFGENGIFEHPGNGLIEEILHVPLSFIGKNANKIKIDDKGIFSTRRIHEIISRYLFGEENIFIESSREEIAFGYKRIGSSVIDSVYEITNIAKINNKKIEVYDYSKESEIQNDINDKLILERKIYLKNKISRNLYGYKLPK